MLHSLLRIFRLLLSVVAVALLVRPAPAQTAAPEGGGPVLTLDEAIRLALQRNKLLKVSGFYPKIARANLLVARGAFDPAIVLSRTYSSSQFATSDSGIPVVDASKVDYYSAGLTGLLPTGTVYTVSGSTVEYREIFNGTQKTFDTAEQFSVTQPLLNGFGFSYNLEGVRVAKANRTIQDLTFRLSAIATVTNVVIAYSNLQLAHDQLNAANESQALAASLVAENEKEYKIGSISKSDVIQARANRAVYDEPIVIAERAVRDAQNQLRELIGEEVFLEDEPLFTLAPVAVPDVVVDRREDLRRAFANRPDYEQARLGIYQNKAREAYAANALLPTVNLNAAYGYEGVSDSFYTSRQMAENRQNPTTAIGLSVNIPLSFAVGRGNMRAARLTREQSEENLKSMEADIAVAVATADGQIETSRKRVEVDRASYALAKQALDAEEKKKKAGQSSTLYVVQEQQLVNQVENSISNALAAERQAVAIYDQTLGTTLERYSIKLAND